MNARVSFFLLLLFSYKVLFVSFHRVLFVSPVCSGIVFEKLSFFQKSNRPPIQNPNKKNELQALKIQLCHLFFVFFEQ